MRIYILAIVMALAALLVTPVFAVDYVRALNIVDFGATPNSGVPDNDSTAIQNAINAACSGSTTCRSVYIPAGRYDLATTITIDSYKHSLRIVGDGAFDGRTAAPSILKWNPGSSGGTMINTTGLFGFRMTDVKLDGNSMADVLIKVNSENGCAAAQWNMERVNMVHATKGFELGSVAPLMCDSDMTFTDLCMNYMTYGFNAMDEQNVDFVFIRPNFQNMSVALKFDEGGVVDCTQMTGAYVGTVLQLGSSGSESYFNFDGVKMETQIFNGKRTQILNAPNGYNCAFNFTGLWVNTIGYQDEQQPYTPLFNVGKGATLSVRGSQLTSNVLATMSSVGSNMATSASFVDCIFRGAGDPRTTITRDNGCQVDLRNCKLFGGGMIPDFTLSSENQALTTPVLTGTMTADSSTKINLSWSAVTGCTGYRVERSPNGTTGWTKLGAHPVYTTLAGTTTLQDTGLTADTTYYYRVRAYLALPSSEILSAYSNVASVATNSPVQITSPLPGTHFFNPASISIDARSDVAGTQFVDLSSDGFFSRDTTSPYNAVWNSPAVGVHNLLATADDGNDVFYSRNIPINVWGSQDIGAWGGDAVGSASLSGSTFTVSGPGGAGTGILMTTAGDTCHFAYTQMSGNFTIIARVAEMPDINSGSMGGVMIRATLNSNSPTAFVGAGRYNWSGFNTRADAGANKGNYDVDYFAYLGQPVWVKLVRNGTSVSGFHSSDGVNWVQHDTARTISIGTGSVYVGLASTSWSWGSLGVTKLDNVSITAN